MLFKTGPRFSIDFLTIFRAKTVPKIDPKSTQKSTSAPQGLPEASGERPRASRKPPGSHFGTMLDPFWDNVGPHLGPPGASCISLGALLPSTRSTRLSQAPFEITVQKVFSEPLKARCAIRCWLSGRFGARMRPQEIRPLSRQNHFSDVCGSSAVREAIV